jgi:hypothetical protein
LPAALFWAFGGPIWWLLPLAQRSAAATSPWLEALLEARHRAGLTGQPVDTRVLAADLAVGPLTAREAQQIPAWQQWELEADVLRLVRLVEASWEALEQAGRLGDAEWAEWPVAERRYWALVVTLGRLEQRYRLLAQRQGKGAAWQWLAAAKAVWRQATRREAQPA